MRLLPYRFLNTAQHDLSGCSPLQLLPPFGTDNPSENGQTVHSQAMSSPAEASRLPSMTASKPVKPSSAISSPYLPYHVHRTASQELPIYHLAKRGGNLQQTRIRKIEGDIVKLRDELQTTLKLKKEHVVINQITGHVLLKVCR